MEQKTHDILLELKNGKDAQTAAWLSHPTDYADLVTSVETAASGAGQDVSIGNTLAALANTPLYEDAETMMLPAVFVSADPADVISYPNYLSNVLQDFAEQVTEYKANAAQEQPIIYAPPLPIDIQESRSLANCFSTCRWLVSIDTYNGSAYATDIARLNAITAATSMFQNCASLVSLPNKWKFNAIRDANNMFYGCVSLQYLPDGFSMANCRNLRFAFRSCKSLTMLPDEFDFGAAPNYSQIFYFCKALHAFPLSLTFKMSLISNAQSQGEYSTDSTYNAMFQMFYQIGFDDYEDETSNCITNEFTIDPTVQGYTGGIKFDIILWHNGYQKLSPESVASLLHCLYDYATNDPTYANRIPSGCTNGGRTVPTAIVSSAMEDALYEVFDEVYQTDLDEYMESIGWEISFV